MAEWLRGAVFWTLAAVVIYVIFHLWLPYSEGFKFIEQAVKNSPQVQARVGEVHKVTPMALGPHRFRYSNADQVVSLEVSVSGSRQSIGLNVEASKTNGVWAIVRSTSDEQALDLN